MRIKPNKQIRVVYALTGIALKSRHLTEKFKIKYVGYLVN